LKVLIAVPTTGRVHKHVMGSVLRMHLNPCGHDLGLTTPTARPVDSNRNATIRSFLKTDFDYLLFVDDDNPPMPGVNPLEAVELGHDLVAFPTPMFVPGTVPEGRFPVVWNCFDDDEETGDWKARSCLSDPPGLEPIDGAGSGCMLISRRLLETVSPPWFLREYDSDGVQVRGSDLLFCRKAKAAGFTVMADYSRPCRHYKEVDLASVYQAGVEASKAGRASAELEQAIQQDKETEKCQV
jgi:hypothetical protein